MDKYLQEQAMLLGMTKIEYIRFILNKDRENYMKKENAK